jgi:hypothetical protein
MLTECSTDLLAALIITLRRAMIIFGKLNRKLRVQCQFASGPLEGRLPSYWLD